MAAEHSKSPGLSLGIVGAGLVGGSVVAAAAAAEVAREILLLDSVARHSEQLAERHAAARPVADLAELAACDIIFVCTPVSLIASIVLAIGAGPVIVDVGSVKHPVLAAVEAGGGNPRYVPGHPLSGGTSSGPGQSSSEIITERPFVLCPYEELDAGALALARSFLTSIGAPVVELEARAHDRILALTSHTPHLIAFALVATLAALPESERAVAEALMPNSFGAITRFALSDARMWSDILAANREAIDTSWKAVADQAAAIGGTDAEALPELLGRFRAARERLDEERGE